MSIIYGIDKTFKWNKLIHQFSEFDIPKFHGKLPDDINKNQQLFCIIDKIEGKPMAFFILASKEDRKKFQIATIGDYLINLTKDVAYIAEKEEFKELKADKLEGLFAHAKQLYDIKEAKWTKS